VCFTLFLPSLRLVHIRVALNLTKRQALNAWGAMKVLIVEDNAGVRRVIKSLVAGLADKVWECANGAGAMALYNRERPDFVLMDIQLEGTDGIAATQQIKAADPMARIIIVTDYDQPDLREAARKAGASGYVVKENLLELVDLLQRWERGDSRNG
jgi:CheY-like chemotaxis protein